MLSVAEMSTLSLGQAEDAYWLITAIKGLFDSLTKVWCQNMSVLRVFKFHFGQDNKGISVV